MRIKGFNERLRWKRIFTASFLTVPIVNAGFNRPKNGVYLEDVVPEDVRNDKPLTKEECDFWREELKKAREGG